MNLFKSFFSLFLLALVMSACNTPSNKTANGTNASGAAGGNTSTPVVAKETTAEDLLKQMRDVCKADVEKFDNYSLVMEDSSATVLVRKIIEGGKPKVESRVTAKNEQNKEVAVGNQNPYELWNHGGCGGLSDTELMEIAKATKWGGIQSLDGSNAYVLQITQKDLKKMGATVFNEAPAGTDTTHIKIWVDPASFAVRQMQRTQSDKDPKGKALSVMLTAKWSDFKTVKNLLMPHTSTLVIEGKGIGLPAAQMAAAKKKLEDDRKNVLPTLPKDQQARAVKFLAQQEKQLAGMSEDRIEQVMHLSGMRVNDGIPQGIF